MNGATVGEQTKGQMTEEEYRGGKDNRSRVHNIRNPNQHERSKAIGGWRGKGMCDGAAILYGNQSTPRIRSNQTTTMENRKQTKKVIRRCEVELGNGMPRMPLPWSCRISVIEFFLIRIKPIHIHSPVRIRLWLWIKHILVKIYFPILGLASQSLCFLSSKLHFNLI
jgi:hypothetical protein